MGTNLEIFSFFSSLLSFKGKMISALSLCLIVLIPAMQGDSAMGGFSGMLADEKPMANGGGQSDTVKDVSSEAEARRVSVLKATPEELVYRLSRLRRGVLAAGAVAVVTCAIKPMQIVDVTPYNALVDEHLRSQPGGYGCCTQIRLEHLKHDGFHVKPQFDSVIDRGYACAILGIYVPNPTGWGDFVPDSIKRRKSWDFSIAIKLSPSIASKDKIPRRRRKRKRPAANRYWKKTKKQLTKKRERIKMEYERDNTTPAGKIKIIKSKEKIEYERDTIRHGSPQGLGPGGGPGLWWGESIPSGEKSRSSFQWS